MNPAASALPVNLVRVLCSNACGYGFKHLFRDFPAQVGWLISPGQWKTPYPGLFYALDNGAFGAWTTSRPWDEAAWRALLAKSARFHPPAWALVPDVVADKVRTLIKWDYYAPIVRELGLQTAFAVQDGMDIDDVPANPAPDVVFVGGTTAWKWATVPIWARHFERVHVGRVRQDKLLICDELEIESCDGTGWFREGQTGKPVRWLRAFLSGHLRPHPRLFPMTSGLNGHPY